MRNHLHQRWAELKEQARHSGWSKLILYSLLSRILQLLNAEILYVRATPIDLTQSPPPLPRHFSVRRIRNEELRAAVADKKLGIRQQFVDLALRRGYIAFGAYDRDKLVAHVWRSTGIAGYHRGVRIEVKKPYSLIQWAFCLPEYRGQRLLANILLRSDPYFVRQGFAYRTSLIHLCNLSSLRAAKSIGSRFLGFAGFAVWFDRHYFFRTPAVKRIGLELKPENRNPIAGNPPTTPAQGGQAADTNAKEARFS